jgi:Dyp-type peroxidase family
MTWAFITIVVPLDPAKVDAVRTVIETHWGNPAQDRIRERLNSLEDEQGVHFASLHAFASPDEAHGHILFEATVDGDENAAIARLAKALSDDLTHVFTFSRDWRQGTDLTSYMVQHKLSSGYGLMDQPGLPFAGTPGMTVGQIRKEAALRQALEAAIAAAQPRLSPLHMLHGLRDTIKNTPDLNWALQDLPATDPVQSDPPRARAISPLIIPALKIYFWPVMAALSITILGVFLNDGLAQTVKVLLYGLFLSALFIAAFFGLLRAKLLSQEKTDWVNTQSLNARERIAINTRENRCGVQNHMISMTLRKPGWVRWFTQRVSFFIIAILNPLNGRPGYLGSIGTIHAARWVTLPGTRMLVFLSNYDGSFESYLEDFITKEHEGLTSVWSNTIGFPRAVGLFGEGAKDAEAFKRFTRNSMIRTSFWYSAYPELSTDVIRANVSIRRGFVLAESEDEAAAVLSQFGSRLAAPETLETDQIQSIVFGGMGYMPESACLLLDLPDTVNAARAWLAAIAPAIAFGEVKHPRTGPRTALAQLALSPGGLAKLGLDPDGLGTFPAAFTETMIGTGRDHILGDPAPDHRQLQFWWGADRTPDATVLIYAKTKAAIKSLQAEILEAGARNIRTIPLAPLDPNRAIQVEPFGFADGVSQPVIAGTQRARRTPDPLHVMQPGEFILGYKDNRGQIMRGPMMDHRLDPGQSLSLYGPAWSFDHGIEMRARDIGRNGSFLVIRHLEQHVNVFNQFCTQTAETIKDRFDQPDRINAEMVAAKMIGRWKNGTPLVRAPDEPPENNTGYTNDFLFGAEDPQGHACPYGAHVRRANPRDSKAPGSPQEITLSNRHRILRIGRSYAPEKGQDPGILFMCLNADIERQFEFIQQTWLNSHHFHGLHNENDPTIGQGGNARNLTVPTRNGPVILKGLPDFATTRGGGYFFMPGKRLITYFLQK